MLKPLLIAILLIPALSFEQTNDPEIFMAYVKSYTTVQSTKETKKLVIIIFESNLKKITIVWGVDDHLVLYYDKIATGEMTDDNNKKLGESQVWLLKDSEFSFVNMYEKTITLFSDKYNNGFTFFVDSYEWMNLSDFRKMLKENGY